MLPKSTSRWPATFRCPRRDAYVSDDEGEELLDVADAQIEAAETLADMTKELSMRAPSPLVKQMSVEVRDAAGPYSWPALPFRNALSEPISAAGRCRA